MRIGQLWLRGLVIGVGFLTPGCSDSESTHPKELTTAQEQEFKAQYDAKREVEGKTRAP